MIMESTGVRPPYVEFKKIAKEDPKRSVELGYRVTKDVDMVFIMQAGSKDQVERIATEWLASIKRKLLENAHDAYPEDWVSGFHKKFEMWKEGHDIPVNGTSVKEWPVLSPAQAENFIALRILTVEDVAAMTEESLGRFGMGARELKDKATKWLADRAGKNLVEQENAELREKLEALTKRLEELEKAPEPVKRGRKPKEE